MKLSIVIPTLNEAAHIAACLQSVRSQALTRGDMTSAVAMDDITVEVIVVDGGSTDDTVAIASPHAGVITGTRGRGAQMNAGARAASGDALLFLHGDSRLAPGALHALRDVLQDPAVAGGSFTLRFDQDSLALRTYAWFTQFRFGLFHYGDQGIFVRRTVFEAMRGYREMPLMEDVDFLARLARMGRVALVPRPVTTSARRFVRRGVVRQQLVNVVLVALYLAGVPPARLARWYAHVR